MLSAAHTAVNSFDRKNSVVVYTKATDCVAKRLDTDDHGLPGGGSIGLVLHDISDDSGCLEACSPEEPRVSSYVLSRHRSPDIEGDGVER